MGLTLSNTQQSTLTLKASNRGQPAKFEGPVQWDTSDPTIATLEPDSVDGSTALLKASGLVGSCKVLATVDALVGQGSVFLVGQLDVEVVVGNATVLELEAGPPEEQP